MAQPAHAPDADGIGLDRARRYRGAADRSGPGRDNARHRRRRNTRRRTGASASAAVAASEKCAGRWAYSAHTVVAGMAERHRAQRRHLRRGRRDLLYRPARRRVAGGDGAGVSVRDPDHDDVGRRHGRRGGVGNRPRARRRRQGARERAGGACAVDQRLLRPDVHVCHAGFWTGAAGKARRPR